MGSKSKKRSATSEKAAATRKFRQGKMSRRALLKAHAKANKRVWGK